MNFFSTRNAKNVVRASDAISQGISKDGGLFVPADFPFLGESEILALCDMDYAERAAYIFSKYLTAVNADTLGDLCRAAYEPFDEEDPATLMKLDDGLYVLELFHGPTLSYKDIALTVFPHLLNQCRATAKKAIVFAAEGVAGTAAVQAFQAEGNTKVAVFYSEESLSSVQKLQLTTQQGDNVAVFAVEGEAAECQAAVKNIFADTETISQLTAEGYEFISANTDNFATILPQVVCYFSVYCDLVNSGEIELGEEINFSVPADNLGNLLAGYYAQKMGLPIQKLICASQNSSAFTDFFQYGKYSVSNQTDTLANDLFVNDSLERLLFELFNRDEQKMQAFVTTIQKEGEYSLTEDDLAALQEIFYCGVCGEEENADTIFHFYEEYVYALDPHTASAVAVLNSYICEEGDETPCVCVATASPYQFPTEVYRAIAEKEIVDGFKAARSLALMTAVDIPDAIAILKEKEVRFTERKALSEVFNAAVEFAKK